VRAFRAAARTGFRGTDTASTVEACGGAVGIVRGRARNIKVTFPEDLSLAEVLASGGDSDPGG
jgi:2-C-methyl-D-erythritol 4-phosphate cytidylyltransferase